MSPIQPQPISVLHFTNALARSGAEEHILLLLKLLDRKCFRLHLVCPPGLARQYEGDIPSDVKLIPLALHWLTQLGAAWRFSRILRKRRIEILHSHQFRASLSASPIGYFCRVPVIVETPHVRELWRKGWLKGNFAVDRLAGRCVDHYIAVSHANCRYLVEEKRLPAEKITVIHNGSDLKRFDPNRPPPPGLKESLDLGRDDPILVCLARLEPQKGHTVLLEAMPRIRHQFPAARLLCVGEGSLRQDLEAQAQKLDLQDNVRFVGYQANVEDWLAMADVAVLSSYFEGLPIVAVEALAAGRPLVATAVDGTPEIVVNGKTGLTVPAGDPQRLAQAICRLLGNRELRLSLGTAGRQLVLEQFSQEQQVEKTQQLYLALWEQGRRGRVCRPAVGGSQ